MDHYSASRHGDHGVGDRVLDMMNTISREAESPAEVQAGLAEVRLLLHDQRTCKNISVSQHSKLVDKFVTPIAAIQNKLFLGCQESVGTFSARTAG